jgi:hypothetical protein
MNAFPLFFSTKYKQIKNFFIGISNEEEKFKNLQLNTIESYSYINENLALDEKIGFEKRRRYQTYMALDYLLSVISYFDFFSRDSFFIAQKAKEFTQLFEKKIVTSDLLLLPFFELTSDIKIVLDSYGISEKEVTNLIFLSQKNNEEKIIEKGKKSFKNFLLNIDIPLLSEALIISKPTKYSYEINQIFEKAAENALKRFKTPVVSSEILLITMLEAKKSKVGKLLKQFLKNDTNWYMFRYALMKRLHNQELSIRTDVPKNQQYFAYLLKTQLPEIQFDTLIEKDCLLPGVLLFRNNMIADVMKMDIYENLKSDVIASIQATSVRKYST